MSERIDIIHRRHRIIASDRQPGPAAVVYDGGTKLCETDGPTVAAALQEARGWIDQLLDGQRTARRVEHVGTVDEYCRAFQALSIGKHHEAMLRAHANAADHTLTATELARAAGYDCYQAANAHYGRLGRLIADFLELPPRMERDEPVWTCVLAGSADGEEDEHRHWKYGVRNRFGMSGRPADLDHGSRLDQIEATPAALGKRLTVDLSDAA